MSKQWKCPECLCETLKRSQVSLYDWACRDCKQLYGKNTIQTIAAALNILVPRKGHSFPISASVGQPPKKALGIPYNGGNYQYNPNSPLQCSCGYSGTCYTCLSVATTIASGYPVSPLPPQQQLPQHQSINYNGAAPCKHGANSVSNCSLCAVANTGASLGGLYKASLPPNAAFPCCNQAGGFHVDPLAPCPLIRRFSTSPPGYAMPWEVAQAAAQLSSSSSIEEPKCECGAEKSGSGGHSHWCPKAGK